MPSAHSLSQEDLLLLEVGRCLRSWSSIELHIGSIYAAMLVDPQSMSGAYEALRKSFDSVVSIDARLSMTTAATQNGPHADGFMRENWPTLHNKIKSKYKKRNEIAHFAIVRSEPSDPNSLVLQPFYTFSNQNDPSRPLLSLQQLVGRTKSFEALRLLSGHYAVYASLRRARSQEARAQAKRSRDMIRSGEVVGQIPKAP